MTPLQKLTRLAQIERESSNLSKDDARRISLTIEKSAILGGVGSPPSWLANNSDPADWALAMAETFPNITQEEVFPWLDAFASAVYDKGRENGTKEALHHINAGTQGIIDCLRTIRAVITDANIMDERLPIGNSMEYMSEFITRTLKAAGLT